MKRTHLVLGMIGVMIVVAPSWSAEEGDQPIRANAATDANSLQPPPPEKQKKVPGKLAEAPKTESKALQTVEENAIRETANAYVKAFTQGNARAIAAQYIADAEFIGADGNVTRGRAAIEEMYKNFFEANPTAKIELVIESIKVLSSTVAIEDGFTILLKSRGADPIQLPYTAVHNKEQGQWQVASVREHSHPSQHEHRSQLRKLDWLVGDWVHESDDATVHFSCHPNNSGTYLVRHFEIQSPGRRRVSGIQMIGWDAQSKRFRAWIFDSDGGFAEGFWHQGQDAWSMELSGVTAEGKSASSTSIYTPVGDRTMNFRTIDHQVGGVTQPDSDVVTIVRRAAKPDFSVGNHQDGAPSRETQPEN